MKIARLTFGPLTPVLYCALAMLLWLGPAWLAEAASEEPAQGIVFRQGLVISAIGRYGRNPFHIDPIEAQLVKGQWAPPAAGDAVTGPDGTERTWKAVTASAEGSFSASEDENAPSRRRGGGAYL